jgi:hypothetical protein
LTQYTTQDLELEIENTWIEENSSGFDRVVAVSYFCPSILDGSVDELMETYGARFRARVSGKLLDEMGIEHGKDYLFGDYSITTIQDGTWLSKKPPTNFQFLLRFREEEHFVMFKIHYHAG